MDRQTIIDLFVKDEDYKAICKQIAPDYADDLYQELVLVVLEMPEDKLQALNDTCLKCFFYRAAQQQYCSHNSRFYRMYLRDNRELKNRAADVMQAMEPTFDEDLLQKVDKVMESLDWYDADVMRLYAQKGTIREVSELTGIPAGSLQNTVKRTRSLIKKKVNKI